MIFDPPPPHIGNQRHKTNAHFQPIHLTPGTIMVCYGLAER